MQSTQQFNNLSLGSVERSNFQAFPFHLVTPSPWPLLSSFALLILTSSAVVYFNGYATPFNINPLYLVELGAALVVATMSLWFRDVATEGTMLGDHTFMVQKGLTMGVAFFIVSEVFFFLSIFWAFFHSALSPAVELGTNWPPLGVKSLNPFEVPLLNTIVLLSSGATVTFAHHALIKGNRRATLIGLILTIILAVLFSSLQAIEYSTASFTMADGVYGACFYFGTGFHGAHILIGSLFLMVAFFRIISYHLTTHHHLGFEASILYWHFVDVVWLFLYLAIYWWGY